MTPPTSDPRPSVPSEPEAPTCEVCGDELDYDDCWQCSGEGALHTKGGPPMTCCAGGPAAQKGPTLRIKAGEFPGGVRCRCGTVLDVGDAYSLVLEGVGKLPRYVVVCLGCRRQT